MRMQTETLGSICTRISSGGTPSRKRTEYFTPDVSGHLWVKSKELLDGSINDTEEKITDEGLNNSSAKYYPENTVLVAMYGANVGQLGWLRRPATVNQAICGLVVDDNKADWRYVFYAILQNRGDLTVQAQGAAQQNLNQDMIRQFSVLLPPLPDQRRIASILSAYDELIENNQRRIRILEDMARSLYREWFVHFRYPSHESAPLVDSPPGQIPQGWEVKKLGDVLELKYGKALKKENRLDGNIPVFGSSGIVGQHDTALVKGPGIVVGRKGNVGSVFWCDEDFFVIDTAYFVTAKLPLRFLYYDLQTKNFINNDAAVPGLSRHQAYSLETVVPPDPLLEQFCQLAEGFEQQASTLRKQTANLRRTRDLLLPRLLSGQITLQDIPAEATS